MTVSRRGALSLTTAGLIHIAAGPQSVFGQTVPSTELLIRLAPTADTRILAG